CWPRCTSRAPISAARCAAWSCSGTCRRAAIGVRCGSAWPPSRARSGRRGCVAAIDGPTGASWRARCARHPGTWPARWRWPSTPSTSSVTRSRTFFPVSTPVPTPPRRCRSALSSSSDAANARPPDPRPRRPRDDGRVDRDRRWNDPLSVRVVGVDLAEGPMTKTLRHSLAVCLCAVAGCGGGSKPSGPPPEATGLARLNHIVVIVLENWSFDSLYGEMPGAEGLAAAAGAPLQVDATGAAYPALPQTETHLPQTLPNAPFALDPFIPVNADTSTDLTNNFYEEQRQIHGGRMDQFVLYDAAAKGLTMGYYHTAGLPLATEASTYTLCDHFFHGVFGGSLQNHIFL